MTSGEVRRRRGCKASGAAVVGDGDGAPASWGGAGRRPYPVGGEREEWIEGG